MLIDFVLQGERAHVRATDILAAMLAQYPAEPLVLRFARPLTGPARLDQPARPGAAMTGRAGTVGFSLSPDPDAKAARRPVDRTPALHLRSGKLEVFAFRPGTALPARIAAIFDRVHPRQAERFLVRQITLHAGPARHAPILWFRLRISADRRRAGLVLMTPFGRLAAIDFHLVPRG
ncbi:MAG: hypothetical protein C0524_13915 [Rhodobacter sp.]|nr:hypothetical protein [Rhodobacter sp.]